MSEGIKSEYKGIIIKGVGGLYEVRPDFFGENTCECAAEESIICRARGVFRHEGISPLPGDRVIVSSDSANEDGRCGYVISEILPRKNCLIRPPVANLTHIFVVIPAASPKPDLLGADKLISISENLGIEPVIIVNKCDIDKAQSEHVNGIYASAGFSVFSVSAISGFGCDSVMNYIFDKSRKGTVVAAAAGVSGAGKSTLLSRLFPDLKLATGEVSRKTDRGRHTTRHVELYPMDAGGSVYYIADTPGFSLLDFTKFNFFSSDDLPYTYREFLPYLGKCRYTKCTHTKEEGCAVIEGVKNGFITKSRHSSYISMLEELRKKPEWKRRKELECK